MTDLAKMCIYYRAKNGMTQQELAKACGVSRYTIIDVEKGRGVSRLTEAKLRITFGCEKEALQ